MNKKNFLISGSNGLVGSALCDTFKQKGYQILSLVRSKPTSSSEIYYDWENGNIEKEKLRGIDVVIHLAGENIAAKRWSTSQKNKIVRSRIESTKLIASAISEMTPRPVLFLCASAGGYYGDTNGLVSEASPKGKGFLAETCAAWEEASAPARNAGIRVAHLRFGIILSPKGGALAKMLPLYRLGLGGCLGDGKQWMSWISLRDAVSAIEFIIQTNSLAGAVNMVSPIPVTNAEFTHALGAALFRPTFFPLPAFVISAIFGEMGNALLLSSTKMSPRKLLDSGFNYQDVDLKHYFSEILN